MRGRGTALAVDEVPTQASDFVFSLSNASDSDLTANLSLALRAARGNIRCPSKAAVRAGYSVGGVPLDAEPLRHRPTRRPASVIRAAMGFAPPALAKGSIRSRSGIRGNASLAAIWEVPRPPGKDSPTLEWRIVLPLEGKGDHASGG